MAIEILICPKSRLIALKMLKHVLTRTSKMVLRSEVSLSPNGREKPTEP